MEAIPELRREPPAEGALLSSRVAQDLSQLPQPRALDRDETAALVKEYGIVM